MRRYQVKLTAGNQVDIPARGVYVRVIAATAAFSISPDTSQELAGLEKGMGWTSDRQFNNLKLLSDTTQTVEIMAGSGRIDDDRANIEGNIDATSKGATIATANHALSTSAAEILAADTTRRSVIIQNIDASITAYIGVSGVTTSTGLQLVAGQAITLDKAAAAAIYAIAASGTPALRTLSESD